MKVVSNFHVAYYTKNRLFVKVHNEVSGHDSSLLTGRVHASGHEVVDTLARNPRIRDSAYLKANT